MKHTLLISAAALAFVMAAPAYATDPEPEEPAVNAEIVNGQLNMGAVWAGLNMTVYDVQGDVNGTAAAIANSFSAELGGDAVVDNFQQTSGMVGSELNAAIDWVEGDVNLTSASVGNTASIINEPFVPCGEEPECPAVEEASLELTNTQIVGNEDPYAWLGVTASGVGELNGTAAAISNSLSVEAWNTDTSVSTYQSTGATTMATVNATVSDAGSVNLTSAAVANTVSIDNLMD